MRRTIRCDNDQKCRPVRAKERHVGYRRPVTTVVILIIVAVVLGNGHAADTELRNQALSVFRPLAVDGSRKSAVLRAAHLG